MPGLGRMAGRRRSLPGSQRGARYPARVRRRWCLWFLAFFLIGAGWALVTPVNQYPDEADHVYRAVSVVRGQLAPHIGAYTHGTGAIANVPIGIWRDAYAGSCHGVRVAGYCSFASAPAGSVTVVTSEGRNFPLYSALVGWPSLLSTHRLGWYLMRFMNVLLCATMLSSGAVVLLSMRRRPLILAAAVFVGLTPLAISLSGSVNPSGLEAASALCFTAVILALLHRSSALGAGTLTGLGAASGVLLATCRDLGWLWVVLIVLLSMATGDPARWRLLARSRPVHVVLGATAVAVVGMEVWAVHFHTDQVFRISSAPLGLRAAVHASVSATPKLLQETLAYLGWLTIPPPRLSEWCWILALALIAAIGFVTGRRAGLLVVGGAALVVLVPFLIVVYSYMHPAIGIWQGRYTLPLAVSVPVVAIAGVRGRGLENRAAPLARGALVLVVVAQVAVFRGAWLVWKGPRPWYVPTGTVLLLGGALLVATAVVGDDARWRRQRRMRASPEAEPPGREEPAGRLVT
jgi:hypothetical protein